MSLSISYFFLVLFEISLELVANPDAFFPYA